MNNNIETVWEAKSEDVIRSMLELKNKYDMGDLKAIELYGGDGHTLSNKMAEQCISFIGYDINPAKEEGFKQNVANGEFRCCDSVKMMRTMQDSKIGTYNLVSADAPICIYGEDYCEHFEVLQYVYKLLEPGKKALCVFPVTVKPYDTDKEENRAWVKKRAAFYRTDGKEVDKVAVCSIYDDMFRKQGLKVLERCYICREYRNGVDWMYEYMYVLEK